LVDPTLPKRERDLLKAQATAWRDEWCWHPNQLRHAAGTKIRSTVDLNAARQVLGHSEKRTTEIYAEQDFAAAREIMRKFG
jgi:site-specific recombinase XerC